MSDAIKQISGACGAEISGVDLSKPLGNEKFAAVHQALLDHQVIFFRDQDLTPEQQVEFSRRFGELRISEQYEWLEGYPEIIEIVKEPDNTGIVVTFGIATRVSRRSRRWAPYYIFWKARRSGRYHVREPIPRL